MINVTIFDHPLIQHKLSIMRQKETSSKDFRALVSEIAMLMCYEIVWNNDKLVQVYFSLRPVIVGSQVTNLLTGVS